MTCIQNDSGLYGLVIADASSPTINLYFVDLKAGGPVLPEDLQPEGRNPHLRPVQ